MLENLKDITMLFPPFDDDSLIEELYAVMLHMYILTRPGNRWYNPEFPGFSERVNRIMECFEDYVLDEVKEKVKIQSTEQKEEKSIKGFF